MKPPTTRDLIVEDIEEDGNSNEQECNDWNNSTPNGNPMDDYFPDSSSKQEIMEMDCAYAHNVTKLLTSTLLPK